ncbi:Ferric-pseudobactin BN7/BN8 receptor [Carnimonas sp. R-84981]
MDTLNSVLLKRWQRHTVLLLFTLPVTNAYAQQSPTSTSGDGSTRLQTVIVEGAANNYQNSHYVAGDTQVATGLPLSAKETPQSVTVITRQQMDDQKMENLDDVLNNVTGISSQSMDNGGRTTFRARGFDINNFKIDGLQFDGVSGLSGTGNSLNMDLYDHVAVVRGANGLMGGTGDPSATVTMERKRPGYKPALDIKATGGSWGKRRVMLDGSTPLTSDNRIRARTVLSYENSRTFRENERIKRFGGLFNIEADPTDSTRVNIGIQHEQLRHNGASWGSNVPIWFADGSKTYLPRKTNPAADWSALHQRTTTLFFNIDQDLGSEWNLHTSFAQTHSRNFNNLGVAKVNNVKGGFGGFWNPDGSGAVLNALHSESKARRTALDVNVGGPFTLFGHSHDLIFGANGYRDVNTDYSFGPKYGNCGIGDFTPWNPNGCQYRADSIPAAPWDKWHAGGYPNFNAHRTDARDVTHTENYGVYAAGRFTLIDPLKLILGARLSTYRTYKDSYDLDNARTRGDRTTYHGEFTPYAGLVFDIDEHNTLYASYTDVFNPQSSGTEDANGTLLAPEKGKSYEAGWKTSFLNDRVNTELAFFKNEKSNVAEDTGVPNATTGRDIYRTVDGVKSKGIDAEISGEITPDWHLFAGYTYLTTSGLDYRQDPHHMFKSFTTYRLPGALDRLTVGGGVMLQTSREWSTNPGRPDGKGGYDKHNLKTGSYTLVNLMARYDITDRLTATVNIDNLTDRRYYQQYGFYDGMLFGAPRSVTASLDYRFF